MASYVNATSQPNRLGAFQLAPGERTFGEFGEFGQSDAVAGINAVGNAINGIVGSITRADVLKTQSKDRRRIALTVARENTKKLGIQTKGAVEQATIGVERIKATYGSITKLVLGAGAVFAAVIIAGAFAYSLASGDEGEYDIEYEY